MFQEWRQQTLPDVVRYAARTWPESPAVLFEAQALTYAELEGQIAQMRGCLARAGIAKGDHVGYLMAADLDWLTVFFAALELGAVLVPLNLTWTPQELSQGLRLTDARHLVIGASHKGEPLAARVMPAIASAPEQFDGLRTILLGDGAAQDWPQLPVVSLADVSSGAHPSIDALTGASEVSPQDTAMLILTSGSTAFPKPAIHTHETVLCGAASYADGLEAGHGDVFLHCMPNYHVGSIATACLTLLRGATLRLMGAFEPQAVMQRIHEDRASLFWGFDTHFQMMRTHPSYGAYDLSSLTRTMVAANPANFGMIRDMGIAHVGSLYGSTEYMGSQTYFPYRDRHDTQRMQTSNGRPTSGEIRIAHPETGQWLAAGQTGEICVRGPALFKGYYKQAQATRDCMDAEGFFHSGDIGLLDEAGYLYYRGRVKEMIKSGGENVSNLEVETFLMAEVPGVVRALVCATPHDTWGEAVTALLELAPGFDYRVEEVQALCRDRLAGYKIPKRVLFLDADEWRVTPTGKLDRKALAALACDRIAKAQA